MQRTIWTWKCGNNGMILEFVSKQQGERWCGDRGDEFLGSRTIEVDEPKKTVKKEAYFDHVDWIGHDGRYAEIPKGAKNIRVSYDIEE